MNETWRSIMSVWWLWTSWTFSLFFGSLIYRYNAHDIQTCSHTFSHPLPTCADDASCPCTNGCLRQSSKDMGESAALVKSRYLTNSYTCIMPSHVHLLLYDVTWLLHTHNIHMTSFAGHNNCFSWSIIQSLLFFSIL